VFYDDLIQLSPD